MTNEELQNYLGQLLSRLPLDKYVERRFTAMNAEGKTPADMEFRYHGMLRDREPKLADVVKQSGVVVLAEPGGGKSVVARAAVHELARRGDRVPVFVELKEYRGDLGALIRNAAPTAILEAAAAIDDRPLLRAYVLDGIDEIPLGTLDQLGRDLQAIFGTESNATALLTARPAYYAGHRDALPSITSLFHILDFSDKDIEQYVTSSGVDSDKFLEAIRVADAHDEIRNPFVLSVMIERYKDEGQLSALRSNNLSYMVDRLLRSRPRFDPYQQRRALHILGVALETYARNELTEEEAITLIRQARTMSEAEARALLDELYASILNKTANGLGFQMRSYGEFLAAEELQDKGIPRLRELAFSDPKTPIETWINTISYLIELDSKVRSFVVQRFPLWAITASPAAFSDAEKTALVVSTRELCIREQQYIVHHPRINGRKLARFVTRSVEEQLVRDLVSPDDVIRGNALVLLSVLKQPNVTPLAAGIVQNRGLNSNVRYCAIVALINMGASSLVPQLMDFLDRNDDDPLQINLIDMIGALASESQLQLVLPRILRENAMLSAAYYHFREMKSREALVEILLYFTDNPSDLNAIRAEGYVEPILELLPRFFDDEIASLCTDVLEEVRRSGIFPDRSGPVMKFLELIRQADRDGVVAQIVLRRLLQEQETIRRMYFFDEILVSLMTSKTAHWLVEQNAIPMIRELAPHCSGEIREIFRPHSGGIIHAQEERWKAYRVEKAQREDQRTRAIRLLQERLLSRNDLGEALGEFWELKEDYWPELPDDFKGWLARELSRWINACDLEKNIRWEGNSLWESPNLRFVLSLIDRYTLKIDPDDSLVFVVKGWDHEFLGKYHKRFPFHGKALQNLESLVSTSIPARSLEGIVQFLEATGIWSSAIDAGLRDIVRNHPEQGYFQVTALALLMKHGVEGALIQRVANESTNEDLRSYAFNALIERGHRATIERALAKLVDNDLKAGNVRIPDTSPLAWISLIKADFAWDKLARLRQTALELELPMLVGIVTEALVKIDRAKTAKLIRKQIQYAPETWQTTQSIQAVDQERTANIEAAQTTPFDEVLRKLRGATSISQLKVLCEGPNDVPILQVLVAQLGNIPEVLFDSVGGWANLRAKRDPNLWLLGCNEAFIIMDGDEGRNLHKPTKPLTAIAREEIKKVFGLPIEFYVLERYGIENYFTQKALEQVIGNDLSGYFPIPDEAAIEDHLCDPSTGARLYAKRRNEETAKHLSLSDLKGTDLFDIVQKIGEAAQRIQEE